MRLHTPSEPVDHSANFASRAHWRPDVQGLRAIAVVAVMAFHAGLPIPGGFAGVDIFFVISGFVITSLLIRQHRSPSGIRMGHFYLRRFQRLIPALALLVVVVAILSGLILSPLGGQQVAAQTGIGALLFLANAVIQRENGLYFSSAASTNPLLNTWSLSVEEQFYLFLVPLLVLGLAIPLWRRHRRAFAVGALTIGTAVSFAATVSSALATLPIAPWWAFGFYSPLSRAWEFGAGCLVAVALDGRQGRGVPLKKATTTSQAISVLGLAMLILTFWWLPHDPWPGAWTTVPVLGTVLLIVAGRRSFVGGALSRRAAVATGDASYSLYLWHWPFASFAMILLPDLLLAPFIGVLLSIIPALAAFRLVESPLRFARLSRSRLARLGLISFGVPIAACTALLATANSSIWPTQVEAMSASVAERHLANILNCDAPPLSSEISDECIWNSSANGPPIYLVGDSHAGHVGEPVLAAAEALDRPVLVATTSACPFLDVEVPRPTSSPADNRQCYDFVQGSLQFLDTAEPGTVIIGMEGSYSAPGGGKDSNERSGNEVDTGIASTVSRLVQSGQQVILVLPVPTPQTGWDPRVCSLPSLLADGCTPTKSLSQVLDETGQARGAMMLAAGTHDVVLVDPLEQLCVEQTCPTKLNGVILYRDGSHLSVPGSLLLETAFVRALSVQ